MIALDILACKTVGMLVSYFLNELDFDINLAMCSSQPANHFSANVRCKGLTLKEKYRQSSH